MSKPHRPRKRTVEQIVRLVVSAVNALARLLGAIHGIC
jgi:hypothetical protein